MANNNYQGGYQQVSDGARTPKKPVINKGEWIGLVRTRSGKDEDGIRFIPWPDGGGVIHFTLETQEALSADQNGQPRVEKCFIPVNVKTTRNGSITAPQLQSVRPGMKVHIVGKLKNESFTSKRDGTKRSTLVVEAFVFEVLEMPQQGYVPQYNAPGQGGYPAQGGYPPQGGYGQPAYGGQTYPAQGGYPAQSGYPPQGGQQGYPGQPAGGYGAPAQGGYQQPGGYPPQGGAQGYPGQPAQGGYGAPAQGQQNPPYYQPPQGGTQPAGQPQVEHIPPAGPGMPMHDINL